jgi:hypothetical protein
VGDLSITVKQDTGKAGDSIELTETTLGGQRCLVIPDPSPVVQARIIIALDEGYRAIIADPEIPELVKRALLDLRKRERGEDLDFYLKRALRRFTEDVQQILETACSLRAIDPAIDLASQLQSNIRGLEGAAMNNLIIAVGGAILAEQVLDHALCGWREQRDQNTVNRLQGSTKRAVTEHYRDPKIQRESEIEKAADTLSRKMLLHLLSSAGVQGLLGEADYRAFKPVQQPVKIEGLNGTAQS